MSWYIYCFVWFDYNVYYSRYEKSWKKVQNCKKSFWRHDFRTKDEQKGLYKQMIMSINKKINDKNNSKLKTIQILNYEVKQSKMMFLFIFVLFQNTIHHWLHRILFLDYLMMNINHWLLYSFNYDVNQSKMMFLFIFVLFQTTFIIDFIEFYFLNI